jgi:hypothetical protein
MHVGQAFSQSGDKCWNLLFVIILTGEKHLFMQKMSMMLSSFGWRKPSNLCAHIILM